MNRTPKNSYIAFFAIFILAAGVAAVVNYRNFEQKRDAYYARLQGELSTAYGVTVFANQETARIAFDPYINQPEILELYKNAKSADESVRNEVRQQLYKKLLPLYERLKARDVRQFHFFLPNSESFLRFHCPEKYGDSLKGIRHSVDKANAERVEVSGFEEGRIFDGFRNVFPLVYHGEHLGSVEISMDFDAIRKRMGQQFHNRYAFMVRRRLVENKVFANEQKNYQSSDLSDDYLYERDYVADDTIKAINADLKPKIQERLKTGEAFVVEAGGHDASRLVVFFPVKNVQGQQAAYIVSYNDDNTIRGYYSEFIVSLAASIAGILVIIALLYFLINALRLTRASEDRLDLTLKGAGLGLWDWHIPSGEMVINEYWTQMLGYALEEVEPNMSSWEKLVHPDDMEAMKTSLSDHLKGRRPVYRSEHRMRAKSGEWKWILATGKVLERDKDGKPLRMLGIHQDITEQKRLEDSLKKREEQLMTLINATPDIICFKDGQGRWLEANEAALKLFQLENVDYRGKKDSELAKYSEFYYDGFMTCEKTDQIALQKGTLSRGIEIIPRPDGSKKVYDVIKVPLFEEEGSRKGLVVLGRDITEMKKAEEELKKNEKQYRELATLLRLMADNMPDMLWAKNLNNEYIFVNKALCTDLLNAKDTDEPLGKTDMFFATRERNAHPDNPKWHTFGELCMDSDAATLEAMKPMHFNESGNVRGKFLVLDMHKAPLYDSDGKLIGTVGSARDVTAGKEAENQLIKLSTAVTQSPSVIAITDTKGKLEYVNPKFTGITGYSQEEAIGQNPRILKSGEHPPEMYQDIWETISSGKTWRGEMHNKKKNGELFWEMASISPIFDEQGKIINYIKVAEDITKRKQAEEQLHNEREKLFITLQSIGDGVITTDKEGRVTFINSVAEQLTGWNQEGAFGRPFSDVFNIIDEKTGEPVENPVEKVLDSGRIIRLATHSVLLARGGNQRSIADSDAPILDPEGNIVGVVLVFRDVTEQKKREEEQFKIEKLESLGVLAGGIAHDFNNILTAILGNINLAEMHIQKNNEAYPLLAEAGKASLRAKNLTQQLLTFSKGGDPVRETASIKQVITDSADFILHGSDVRCRYAIPEDLWLVDIDTGQMSQVIQNLVINARHAMPEGGEIKISCENIADISTETALDLPGEKYIKIIIADHGGGIPGKYLDKIFDPYFSTKQQGSGLGLAITHSIIKKHEGHITVQSKPGEGTIFTIYLPASAEQKFSDLREEAQEPEKSMKGTILIMDDEEMIRDLAELMLSHFGHEVLQAKDGKEAIAIFKERYHSDNPVDVIIMDLTIPGGMGGEEAIKEILKIDPEAKAIVSSGYANDPVIANYGKYGFKAALGKPFEMAKLKETINSVLG